MAKYSLLLNLDPAYKGSCPCADFMYKQCKVLVHCWRTAVQCECGYSGVHIYHVNKSYARQVGLEILKNIQTIWDNTDWNLYIVNELSDL